MYVGAGHRRGRDGVSIGTVKVPDSRVDALALIYRPRKVVYAELSFTDLGGGRASGLDRGTLHAMRDMDALCHVLRAFPGASDGAPDPAGELREVVAGHGAAGERIGVELETYGLTAASWRRVEEAFDGFSRLEDASGLVSELRLVKSPAELECVRRAAELADDALAEAERLAVPGAFEGDILAAMQGAVFRGGGDYPGNEFIIGSGPDALLCRYFSGRRRLGARDQITLEFAGAWRHYHSALMRTLVIGPVGAEQHAMHRACSGALDACLEEVRPGRVFGDVFDAHARVLDAAGLRAHRMNACGYSLGATFAPTWMDGPMFFAGNPRPIRPGMVLFVHIIVADSDAGLAMTLGETVVVTGGGCDRLSRAARNVSPGLS